MRSVRAAHKRCAVHLRDDDDDDYDRGFSFGQNLIDTHSAPVQSI
jgi:hypothetical protein